LDPSAVGSCLILVFLWTANVSDFHLAVHLQDLLDAWLACQATWLYLEPIFSSPDIVKQMPEEGVKFAEVDSSWRAVMAGAVQAPAALPLGRNRSALESLQACNALLDDIQKGLAAYLEKKRLYFPRQVFQSCILLLIIYLNVFLVYLRQLVLP
jgi:hypothetical protein